MVVSGTHSLDMCMWLMEGRSPVEVYARSTDRTLGPIGTKDGTSGIFTMDDGVVFSMNINWALPDRMARRGLRAGDRHRRHARRHRRRGHPPRRHPGLEIGQPAGYTSRGFAPPAPRHVDFVGSYPPGDVSDGLLWGPMREETTTWFARVCRGVATPHATAADGHANLINTMAMDLSARTGTAGVAAHQPRRTDRRARLLAERTDMRQINLGIIGTGWCGGSAPSPRRAARSCDELHLAEIDPARREEIAAQTNPTVRDRQLGGDRRRTPTSTRSSSRRRRRTCIYPMTKAALEAGKHVLLEKPIALTLDEADELIGKAEANSLKFTIGYSQRFNPKPAMIKRAINEGKLG